MWIATFKRRGFPVAEAYDTREEAIREAAPHGVDTLRDDTGGVETIRVFTGPTKIRTTLVRIWEQERT